MEDEALLDREADAIARDIGIPPCPAVLTRLVREARADDPDFRRIGQLIMQDVALSASLLKLANSPFYGLANKLSSVHMALTLLGVNAVTQIVTGLLLRQAFPAAASPGMTRFWNASMGTATIAARLAKETRAADPHVVHTYALFRDCGMPVMLQTRPDYLEVMEGKVVSEVEPIFYVEEERYATTHALIGSTMARSWGLPGDTCLAILQHHHFWHSATSRQQAGPAPQKLVALGIAAEQLHCHRERRTCLEWREAEGWVFETLKLTPASFADLSEAVDEALAA